MQRYNSKAKVRTRFSKSEACDKQYEYIENSNKCQFTIQELQSIMKGFSGLQETYTWEILKENFNDWLLIYNVAGRVDILCSSDTAKINWSIVYYKKLVLLQRHIKKSVKIRLKEVFVISQLLFNIILCVCNSPSELRLHLEYELSACPQFIFDGIYLQKGVKSSLMKMLRKVLSRSLIWMMVLMFWVEDSYYTMCHDQRIVYMVMS